MNDMKLLYDDLATLLSYPGNAYVRAGTRSLDALHDGARTHLATFMHGIEGLSTGELEELYTRTFDINPVSSLELGWHLFGETYERGSFLVKMRTLLRQVNVEESAELPDHLSSALQAFGRMESGEASIFAHECLQPALKKILGGFVDTTNPYINVLRAVEVMVAAQSVSVQGVQPHVNL